MEVIIRKRNNSKHILGTLLLGILFLDSVSASAKKDLAVLNDVKASLDNCDLAVQSLQYLLYNYNISATTTSNQESTTPNSMTETTTRMITTTASPLLSTTNETTESETTTDVPNIITTTSNGDKFTTILTTSNEPTTSVESKTTTPEQLSTTTTKTTVETTLITTTQELSSTTNTPTTVITTPITTTQKISSIITVPTTIITTLITTTKEPASTTTVPTTIITTPITTTEEPASTTILPLTTTTSTTGGPIGHHINIVDNIATENVLSWNQNVSDVLTNISLILDEISINPINEGYAADLNVETELLNCFVDMGNNDSTLIEESGIEDLITQANGTEYIIVSTETIVDDEIKKKQDIRDTNILVAWLVPLLVIIVVVAVLCVIYKPWNSCCNTSSKSSTSSSQTIHDFPTSFENEKGFSNPSLTPREDKGHPTDPVNLRMQYMDRVYKVTPKASTSA